MGGSDSTLRLYTSVAVTQRNIARALATSSQLSSSVRYLIRSLKVPMSNFAGAWNYQQQGNVFRIGKMLNY